jgi:hypothetical protein
MNSTESTFHGERAEAHFVAPAVKRFVVVPVAVVVPDTRSQINTLTF